MQNTFLLHAFLMGIYITLVYDGLRILRRVISHRAWVVSLEDLIFWIFCAAQVFGLLYREGNGSLRWFAVLGAGAGMFLYRKTLSPLLVKYLSLLLEFLYRPLQKGLRHFRFFCKKRLTLYRKFFTIKKKGKKGECHGAAAKKSGISEKTSE